MRWKIKYEENTDDKFAELAKKDTAEYVVESIDKIKEERLLWKSLSNARTDGCKAHLGSSKGK